MTIHERPLVDAKYLPKRTGRTARARQRLTDQIKAVIGAHPHDGRYIYFVHCQEFVKIGYAFNPHHRASGLRSGTPFDQLTIAIVPGSIAAERALHEFFAAQQHKGEWFRLSREQRKAIAALPGNKVKFLTGYSG